MSFRIPFAEIDDATKKLIAQKCTVRGKRDEFTPTPPVYYCFRVNAAAQEVTVPLGLWRDVRPQGPPPNDEEKHAAAAFSFAGELYTAQTDPHGYRDQDVVAAAALAKLAAARSVFLALNTGFGKTRCAIYLVCALGLKTLVVCHFQEVNKQWRAAFETLAGAKVQLLSGSAPVDPTAHVYVAGVAKLQNLLRAEERAFADVGVVVVDEAHRSTVAIASKCLLGLSPKYLIGLTATPDRADTLDRMYRPYFGPADGYIVRTQTKSFTIVKVVTPYKPELVYVSSRGRTVLDWTTVQNSLAYNEHRNRDAVALVREHPAHVILVLCNRVVQAETVHRLLAAAGEKACLFVSSSRRYDPDARVLVTTVQKLGVGFNDERFTMLVLLADVKDVRQLEGRIRTLNNVIYDYVDANRTLENHWRLRRRWYRKRGATVTQERRGVGAEAVGARAEAGAETADTERKLIPRFFSPSGETR